MKEKKEFSVSYDAVFSAAALICSKIAIPTAGSLMTREEWIRQDTNAAKRAVLMVSEMLELFNETAE